jgi:hypothetical protein
VLCGASHVLISLPIYDRLGFRVDFNGIIIAANLETATEKLSTSEREQTLASLLEPLYPFRSAWTETNLTVEESDVGLVKGVLLDCRFPGSLAHGLRQFVAPFDGPEECVLGIHTLST